MIFHSSLSDSKFPQVSNILLSIMADLNYAVVWMVSSLFVICKFSSPSTNPLLTVAIAIDITVIFTLISFFHFTSKV